MLVIHNKGGFRNYLELLDQNFGNRKSEMFKYNIDKVRSTTQGWNKQFLYLCDKEVV